MTPQGTITVERMDGSAAAQAVDAFRLVYADVFAEPPYNEAADDVTAAFRQREDGNRAFGLMELAVRRPWRGQGVARRLHETLLDGIEAERVLLNVHPDSKAASAAYQAWGYRRIGEARPWEGPALYDVMLLDLRT
ncbi:hypothetical protein ADK57_24675 [Streptomyces sp. MMG1533]|uniref:GNAT family N-acetyltransferase n=1 Tax=Streptomyces sp. MMG1533 TaxID=1415546 RepID=UPI0006AF8F4A|nr:GNAT family N-acetyltransferase [Streptomyces sp. MMG1533]KOU62606.1 hypothetical protein ADK57_24675 [Streptomyces sp. MMG1533]